MLKHQLCGKGGGAGKTPPNTVLYNRETVQRGRLVPLSGRQLLQASSFPPRLVYFTCHRYANGEFPQDYVPTVFDNYEYVVSTLCSHLNLSPHNISHLTGTLSNLVIQIIPLAFLVSVYL